MNLFKKKYKRSEWFKGLLEAENLVKKGFVKDHNVVDGRSVLHLWFKSPDGSYHIGIDCFRIEFCQGVLDYMNHREEYLK